MATIHICGLAPPPQGLRLTDCYTLIHGAVSRTDRNLYVCDERPARWCTKRFTSCALCAMSLGATLWRGVRRVLAGAARADASRLTFEEGPVFPACYADA